MYDKKYLQGRWFAGKMYDLCSPGWRWVTHDAIWQLFLLENSDACFPVNRKCIVIHPENIEFEPSDIHNFQGFGNYYQAIGKIHIGRGTYIGPNVG